MTKTEGFDRRAHDLLDGTIAFAALLDSEGNVQDVNKNALAAAGISIEDVRSKPFWSGCWFAHDPNLQGRIREQIASAASGMTVRFSEEIWTEDEGQRHVDWQVSPIKSATGEARELLVSGCDVTERETTKARLELALRDSSHRIKNIFSTIRAMAHMTRRFAPRETAMEEFLSRFDALSTAHHILSSSEHDGSASFPAITSAILKPHLTEDMAARCTVIGPSELLAREQGKLLALCLHELATNSVKYGALSKAGGSIEITLSDPDDAGLSSFRWVEVFDIPVAPSSRTGFGSQFIQMTLEGIFGAEPKVELTPNRLSVEVRGTANNLFESVNDPKIWNRTS